MDFANKLHKYKSIPIPLNFFQDYSISFSKAERLHFQNFLSDFQAYVVKFSELHNSYIWISKRYSVGPSGIFGCT